MGEYKEASLWMRIAYFLCLLGFILALFGWAPTATGYTEGELALFIIALIALLAAVILAVGIIYWDEFKGKIALIIFAVVTLLAGTAPFPYRAVIVLPTKIVQTLNLQNTPVRYGCLL